VHKIRLAVKEQNSDGCFINAHTYGRYLLVISEDVFTLAPRMEFRYRAHNNNRALEGGQVTFPLVYSQKIKTYGGRDQEWLGVGKGTGRHSTGDNNDNKVEFADNSANSPKNGKLYF